MGHWEMVWGGKGRGGERRAEGRTLAMLIQAGSSSLGSSEPPER